MACTIFFLVKGEPVQMEVAPETHVKMRLAAFERNISVATIASMAVKKYGRLESSILKFLKKDLKRFPKK